MSDEQYGEQAAEDSYQTWRLRQEWPSDHFWDGEKFVPYSVRDEE